MTVREATSFNKADVVPLFVKTDPEPYPTGTTTLTIDITNVDRGTAFYVIARASSDVAEIDYVTRAPDGKEVEEITKKEIHKALRARVAVEQVKMDISRSPPRTQEGDFKGHITPKPISPPKIIATTKPIVNRTGLNKDESDKLKGMLDGLIGTRGAYILDQGGNILGKVPVSELATTVSGLRSGVHTLVFDGSIDRNLVSVAERYGVRCLVGMNSQVKPSEARLEIVTSSDL